ncbi:MAG: transketolase family protein, partial [Firmicutes bacterium]|nr:transketolase family protein [Bacillota bacterium]
MESKALRDVFGEKLIEIGRGNDKVVVLDADVSGSTKSALFGEVFPDRFFNVGIAEANMVSMAAGLAAVGLIPFVSTFSFLLTLRAADQMRTQIAYTKLPVKFAAGYGGLSDSFDGATHHAICDLALARSLPNMTVMVPGDPIQTKALTQKAADLPGPVYLRLSRAEAPNIFSRDCQFEVGKGVVLAEGDQGTIMAT